MKKADIILLLAILTVGIASVVIFMLMRKDATYVSVTVNGETIGMYELYEDGEIVIETEDGGENILQICEGKVQMISANCPNQDCVRHKEIFQSNESIICLPHKVVVVIVSESSQNNIDTVVY